MQGRHHFAARTVAINAQNTVVAVRRFAAKNICAVFIAIEAHAEGFKVAYAVGRLARDKTRNRRIDQSGTGGAGVSGMGFNTVARCQCRGNAALGPIAGSAFAALAAGQNGDLARGELQRGKQASQTCADNQHIAGINNIRGWRTHARITNLSRSCARRRDARVRRHRRPPPRPRAQKPAPQELLAG